MIAFFAADPSDRARLRLAEECAEIQREIKMMSHRDDVRFESRWAVTIDDLMRHLLELDPTVVHLSGHGATAGMMLQDEHGQALSVPARALGMMIEATSPSVRVMVLSACYTAKQAAVLRHAVDCVVGMDGAIGDDARRMFAVRFHGALASRRSVGNAFAQGIAALAARQLPDELLPRCVTRDGIEADAVIVARAARGARRATVARRRRSTARGLPAD